MKVDNSEFWELVETKLFTEKLYRYIPLSELTRVAHALATIDEGSRDLFSEFELYFIKHKKNLLQGDVEYAREAFNVKRFETQNLLEAFDDAEKIARLDS